jgi:hypothetical protein
MIEFKVAVSLGFHKATRHDDLVLISAMNGTEWSAARSGRCRFQKRTLSLTVRVQAETRIHW